MRKNRHILIGALLALLMCVSMFAACGGSGCNDDGGTVDPPERTKPTVTVDTTDLSGTVGKPVSLPAATASDEVDGDISSQVKVNVYFDRDGVYTFPAVNPQAGTDGSVVNAFTPKKVGTYAVIYTVKNSANQSAREEIELTVGESTDPRAPQLLADKSKWTLDSVGTAFDGEGNIVMSSSGDGVSLAYNAEKVKSGDMMTFRFNADMPTDAIFYFFGGPMSKSYDGDAPSAGEAGFPERLSLRIRSTNIEAWVANVGDKNMTFEFGTLQYSLLDGFDHVVSLRHTLDAEAQDKTITTEVWIDEDTDGEATHTAVTKESEVIEFFGETVYNATPYLKDMFDAEKFGGWMNMGAWRAGLDTGTMRIKSATINAETPVLAPELKEAEFEPTYVVNEPITFPAVAAEDKNDYSDISARVKKELILPDKSRIEIEEDTYTPAQFGKYTCIYSVADKSGNTAYAYYEFSVSKGKSDVLPTFEIEGDTTALTATIGSPFTLPVASNVRDSFGDDISSLLKVELTGCEAADLTGESAYKFYTAGTHTIVYSVTDYNGNTAEKPVNVTVAPRYTAVPLTDFKLTNLTVAEGDFIKLADGSGAVPQKIYGEKVSVLVDLNLSSAFDKGDGINWVCFNMRGGKHLTKVPGEENLSFDWPSGLNFEISESGIKINGTAHSDELGSWAPPVNGKEFFAQGEKEIAWQVTDVYENGRLLGVKVEMWLDGDKLALNTTHKRGDDMFLAARTVAARPTVLQSGWIQVYTHGKVDSANYPNEKASYLRAMTIDGSKPEYLKVTLSPAAAEATVKLGESFTLPTVSATLGDKDVSSQIKAYYWKNGDSEPDYTAEYTQTTVEATAGNINGFKIVYRFGNKTVATVSVGVNVEVSNVHFAKESETVAFGSAVTPPALTFTLGAQDITDGYTVKVCYPNTAIPESEVTDTFTPETIRNFNLEYYYGATLIGTVPVTVTGDNTGDKFASMTADGDYKYITGAKVYDETQAIKFTKGDNGFVDIIMRDIVPHITNSYMDHNYPRALRLRVNGNSICVAYTRDVGEMRKSDITIGKGEHTLKWKATDTFANGKLTGVTVEVWLDGVKVVWNGNQSDLLDIETLTQKASSQEPDGGKDAYNVLDTSYIFKPTNSAAIIHDGFITVSEWYLDGTEPARVVLPDNKTDYTVDLGNDFTLPAVKLMRGREDISTELNAYYQKNGDSEPDYATAAPISGTVATSEENLLGFKIVYRFGNKTVATLSVGVIATVSDVEFSSSAITIELGGSVQLPTVTFKLGAQTKTEGYTVKVCHPNTAIAEETVTGAVKVEMIRNFELRYYYGDTYVGSVPVTVTGEKQEYVDVNKVYSDTPEMIDHSGDRNVYLGRKYYDGKVTVVFNVGVLNGTTDFVVRGKKDYSQIDWAGSLRLRFGGDITIKGYNDSEFGKVSASGYLTAGKDATFTIETTDVFEQGGAFKCVKVRVWIDGREVVWSEGNGEVPATTALANPDHYLVPAYINVTSHESANQGIAHFKSLEFGEPTAVVIPENKTSYSVDLGEAFTLPAVMLKRGEEDLTASLKKYVWINNADEPDYATAQELTDNTVATNDDNLVGFKIVYRFENRTVAAISVSVKAEVSNVVFSQNTLSATVGGTVTLPTVTFDLGAQEMTSGYTVKVSYPDTNIAEKEVSGSFVPELRRDFKLKYYYVITLLGEVNVTVTGADGNLIGNMKDDGDYKYLDGVKVYDETVSVKFNKVATSVVDIMLRSGETSNNSWWNKNYPMGLRIRIGGDGLKIGYNRDCGAILRYASGVSDGEHTLKWKASDVFENDEFVGIKVEVWLDGQKIQWDDSASDDISLTMLQAAVDSMEADDENGDRVYVRTLEPIFTPTAPVIIIHDSCIELKEWYIDGTEPTLA